MCDLISDVITCCVGNCDTVKSTSEKMMFEKREYMEMTNFYIIFIKRMV